MLFCTSAARSYVVVPVRAGAAVRQRAAALSTRALRRRETAIGRASALVLVRRHRTTSPPGDWSPAAMAGITFGGDGEAPPGAGKPTDASDAADGSQRALFALPLFRKPAFPGIHHIIQVEDREILDFITSMRKNGQAEYVGGFMTKKLPEGVAEGSEAREPIMTVPPASITGTGAGFASASGSGKLRRDTGCVESGSELEKVGTLLHISGVAYHESGEGGHLVVMPSKRIELLRTLSKPASKMPLCSVYVGHLPEVEVSANSDDIRALHHEIIATMKEMLKTQFQYKEQFEQVLKYYNLDDPLKLSDVVAGMSMASRDELQEVLAENVATDRLRKVLTIVKRDLEQAREQSDFKAQTEAKFAKEQKKLMLMAHLKHIKRELNLERDDKQTIMNNFKEAIDKLPGVPEEAVKAMETELGRLGNLEPQSPEFNTIRTYLEWMTALPWGKASTDNADIERAEAILNEDHYSLEDVKERILEHMAVSFLKDSVQGKIMCLVGPPGVGKTSIGKSIARALDRKFYRFSVGGLHDVAEIRGHRRTYVGAMPGKLIQGLKIAGVSNPVILIDEVDKLGRDSRGDPASALLEVLDPAQNSDFRDHYLDAPVDLSKVLFVCTANVTSTIPEPLLDRMEVIRLAGYVHEEKVAIANQYLIPQTIAGHGISEDYVDVRPDALSLLIRDYAREAGVRELRKLVEKIARKVALCLVRTEEEKRERTTISIENLRKFVGQPVHTSDRLFHEGTPPGVVMGLAWTALGGKTLFIEARGRVPTADAPRSFTGAHAGSISAPGEGVALNDARASGAEAPVAEPRRRRSGGGARIQLTGSVGKVMSESSEIALTYSRMFLREVQPPNDFLEEASMHMNMPEGAAPKDGPSAGVTMTSALLSLALNKPVKNDLGMAGELTLTGKVLRVHGIKEKTIAARRENVGTIVLPMQNHADYMELKPHLRAGLTVHFVDHYDDVYRIAFGDTDAPMPAKSRGSEVKTVFTPFEEVPTSTFGHQDNDSVQMGRILG